MNLYEIDKAILACIDPETGELLDEAELHLVNFRLALWVRNLCLSTPHTSCIAPRRSRTWHCG